MLWIIVAVVVLGAIFAFGALVGSSVAQTAASDRARRQEREALRRGPASPPPSLRSPRSPVTTRALLAEPLTHS